MAGSKNQSRKQTSNNKNTASRNVKNGNRSRKDTNKGTQTRKAADKEEKWWRKRYLMHRRLLSGLCVR